MAAEQLTGRVAVVTGASSGIGLATARALVDQGASVVLAARSREKLDEAVAQLGPAASSVVTDVTDPADVTALMDATVQRHGRIDVLLANAGVYLGGEVADGDVAAMTRLIETNVNGVILAVHAALPHLRAAGSGDGGGADVLVTSSVSGHQAIHWEPVYSASKHALQSFVHGLRRQLMGSGIRVGAVAPGVVLNDLWQVHDEAAIEQGVAARTGIRSEDVADAIVFMLTRPRHVTIRDLVILPAAQEI